MTDIAELGIKAKSDGVSQAATDLDRLQKAADGAEKATDKLGGATGRTRDEFGRFIKGAGGAETVTDKLGKTTDSVYGSMRRFAGVLGTVAGSLAAAFSITAIVGMADSWSDMQSQMGAAIGDMSKANSMMQRMTQIANASYSPLDQTVQVYARNVAVLRDLGVSAAGAADFTEALNHALVITATKGERAASVQNALSKAMATGKLQADGLETVLANGGKVAEVLAAQLNTTVSGLRKMASDGKITGSVIASALIGNLESLRDVAAEMPATVGDAFTRIGTNLMSLVGNFDQATGASGALAGVIMMLADSLPEIAGMITAAGTAIAVYMLPTLAAAIASTYAWIAALVTLRGALMATGVGALVVGAGVLIGYFIRLVEKTGSFGGALTALAAVASEVWGRIGQGAEGVAAITVGAAESIKAAFMDAFASILEGFASTAEGIANGWNTLMTSLGMPGLATAYSASAGAARSARGSADAGREGAGNRIGVGQWLIDDAMRPLESTAALDGALALPDVPGIPGSGSGTGKGAGGAVKDAFKERLDALMTGLQTERETIDAWYEESMAIINDRRALELLGEEDHAKAKLRIEELYQEQLRELGNKRLSETADFFGALASVTQAGGERLNKVTRTLGAVQALINTYVAQSQVLADPTLGFFGKMAAYATIAAAGLNVVSALGGGGGGGGGKKSSGAIPAQSAPAPQRDVRVTVVGDGMFPDYLRQYGQELFETVMNEGGNRGTRVVMG